MNTTIAYAISTIGWVSRQLKYLFCSKDSGNNVYPNISEFKSASIPDISIVDYMTLICKGTRFARSADCFHKSECKLKQDNCAFCACGYECLHCSHNDQHQAVVSTYILIGRYVDKCSRDGTLVKNVNMFTIHRLLLACMLLSTKVLFDIRSPDSDFANCGGVTLNELNKLEIAIISDLNWNTLVSREEYEMVEIRMTEEIAREEEFLLKIRQQQHFFREFLRDRKHKCKHSPLSPHKVNIHKQRKANRRQLMYKARNMHDPDELQFKMSL